MRIHVANSDASFKMVISLKEPFGMAIPGMGRNLNIRRIELTFKSTRLYFLNYNPKSLAVVHREKGVDENFLTYKAQAALEFH